jgi:uncharacterized membrane protein
LKRNFLTGLFLILPIGLLTIIFLWLFRLVNRLVEPIASLHSTPTLLTKTIVFLLILLLILLFGIAARTKAGKWVFTKVEDNLFSYLPGYKTVRMLVKPFVGDGLQENFKSAALADITGQGILVAGFITDTHEKHYTFFVPTGPNPTNGFIYHLPKGQVTLIDVPVDEVLTSVISLGADSQEIVKAYTAANSRKGLLPSKKKKS